MNEYACMQRALLESVSSSSFPLRLPIPPLIHSKNPKNETVEEGWPPRMGAPTTQKVASADRMGPTPRCIHSSGATRSSLVKIWSLNDENTQLSTCGAGNAVIARSSLPTITSSVAYQVREGCIRTDDIVREVVQVLSRAPDMSV